MGIKPQAIIDWLNRHGPDLPFVDYPVLDWRTDAQEAGMLDELDDEAIAFLAAWPQELMESLTGLVRASCRTSAQLRFAWTPAYDFGMTVSKTGFDEDAPAEYTVHLHSRYPPEVVRRGK
jgi:hypothetical protein